MRNHVSQIVVAKWLFFSLLLIVSDHLKAQGGAKMPDQDEPYETILNTEDIKELRAGDKMPDVVLNMINYKSDKVKLSAFKGKTIILDFWATWCTACVKGMPRLADLQNRYSDKIAVLPVDVGGFGDTREKIKKFLNARKEDIPLPSVYDTAMVLYKSFPHRLIPHCVIIDPQGKVLKITSSEYIDEKSLLSLFSGDLSSLPDKRDIMDMDPTTPLFKNANGLDKIIFHSEISRQIDGITGIKQLGINQSFKMTVYNNTIPELFTVAFKKPYHYSRTRLLLEGVKDSTRYFNRQQEGTLASDEWTRNNRYCYEVVLPIENKEQRHSVMEKTLKEFFGGIYGITGKIEKRKTKCLKLVKLSPEQISGLKPTSTDSIRMDQPTKFVWNNFPVAKFVDNLSFSIKELPLIDGTDLENISLRLNILSLSNFKDLKNSLNRNGFDLVETISDVEMLVISEEQKNQ